MDISIGLALFIDRFHIILLARLSLSRPSSFSLDLWLIKPFENAKHFRTLDHRNPRWMGTNGTPLASDGFCSINYMQSLSVDRAYRYWTQLPCTSPGNVDLSNTDLWLYFLSLTLMILLHHHHHTHPAPSPTLASAPAPFHISQHTRMVIMSFQWPK